MEIPKIIHYCWFGGGELTDLAKKCIASWKRFCPDFEIVEWNEKNFFSDNQYFQEALSRGMFAFASDYARLKIIYDEGGIYFDTDVEIIKDISPLLDEQGFLAMESRDRVNTGLGFAAEKGNEIVGKLLASYDGIPFVVNGVIDKTPCPRRNTQVLKECGFQPKLIIQDLKNLKVYPPEYFCPMNCDTGKINLTKNTFTIHHFSYSWADEESKKIVEIKRKLFRVFPPKVAQFLFNIINKIRRIFKRNKKK